MKRFRIMVNEHAYTVEVGNLSASPIEVFVNGKKCQVAMETAKPPQVSIVTNRPIETNPAPVVAPPTTITTSPVDGGILRAPMPGLILDVCIHPGQSYNPRSKIDGARSHENEKMPSVHPEMGSLPV